MVRISDIIRAEFAAAAKGRLTAFAAYRAMVAFHPVPVLFTAPFPAQIGHGRHHAAVAPITRAARHVVQLVVANLARGLMQLLKVSLSAFCIHIHAVFLRYCKQFFLSFGFPCLCQHFLIIHIAYALFLCGHF